MTPVNGVDLGTSGNYAVLSSTFTRNGGITAITGDLGYTTLSGGGSHTVNGNTYTPAPPQSGLDQAAALVSLDNYGCTFSFADGAVDLASDTTHGLTGIYTPGVYCVNGAMSISGGAIITLNGKGIYIFRSTGAFTSSDNSKVVLTGGADACDVYWTPGQAVTLGADTVFAGTIIDASGITTGNNTVWTGRALAFGGTVTMDTDSIALPVCGINGTLTNTPSATVTETLTLTVSATLTETETFSPTQTLTTLYTFTPTATATTVLIATATASPTFIQTAVVSVSKTYPNPINPLIQDLNVVFILNGYSENVKMLIYTPAFRLVRDIEIGTVPAGKNIAVIPGSKLRGFARGIYYYSVIFKTDGGSETKCSIEKLEILY
jgi:type VI secretion system secreted protein VgrG